MTSLLGRAGAIGVAGVLLAAVGLPCADSTAPWYSASLRVTVRVENGPPVQGARVFVKRLDSEAEAASQETEQDGTALFTGLFAGPSSYDVCAWMDDYVASIPLPTALREGDLGLVDLELRKVTTKPVAGVLPASARSMGRARITARTKMCPYGEARTATVITDPNGNYAFEIPDAPQFSPVVEVEYGGVRRVAHIVPGGRSGGSWRLDMPEIRVSADAPLAGVVTDPTGTVVPNVQVAIRSAQTGIERTSSTSTDGTFSFRNIPTGDYDLTATAAGFATSELRGINIQTSQPIALNVPLQPGQALRVVEVTESASLLNPEPSMNTPFTPQELQTLLSAGGDITNIMSTVPGLVTNVTGGYGNFTANGLPGTLNLLTVNGENDMDPYFNTDNSRASDSLLGANGISEVSVIIHGYDAEFGGARVNYLAKSGTNSFHGNLFHNYNDKVFNANDFFNNQAGLQKPRADAHHFGGSLGGPIKKNKMFFFFNYESLRYALPDSAVVHIPTPQLQAYTLAHTPAAATSLYRDAFALWAAAPGATNAVPETNGSGPLQDGNNHLGCGIGTFWNAGIAAPGGGIFGETVSCTSAFAANASERSTESLITLRGDYNINSKQMINLSYNRDWGVQATGSSFISPVFNSLSNQPSDAGELTYTYFISPTLVNKLIGSGSWYTAIFGVADFNKTTSLMPETFSVSDGCCTSVGASFPTGRSVGRAQLVDDLTWFQGKHSFKFGVNYLYNKITDTAIASGAYKGTYAFADLTDFVNGTVNATGLGSSFSQSYPDLLAAHLRMRSLRAYAQDEWRVTYNLTLTLGFRLEHDGNPGCVDKCFARMKTQFGTPGYVGGANVPYNQTVSAGLPTMYQSLQSVIPEPRFGFAWQLDSKTMIRGDVGLFATLFSDSVAEDVFRNPPSVFTPDVRFGNVGLASDPTSAAYAATAAYNIFTAGFNEGYTLAQIQTALGKIPYAAPVYYSPPNNFATPKTTEWSLEARRSLGAYDVAVTYTGDHGFDQSLSNGWANAFLLLGSNGTNKYYGTSFAGLPTSSPDPRFLTVTQVLAAGYSNYDGMTVQIRHSMNYGFRGQVGWTWSHALGLASVYNPYNLNFGYGNENIDVRHAIVSDLTWQGSHRFRNGMVNNVLGGWNIGLKVHLYTGRPFSSSDSKINAQVNSGGGFSGTFLATVIDPNVAKTCTAVHGSSMPPCFTTSQFMTYNSTSGVGTPVQSDFGATGPGVFRGPGYFDVDTQIAKKFLVKEKYEFVFGGQVYNSLNHPNFSNPTASITSGTLGTATGSVGPPTSIYGSGQGAPLTGRVIVVTAKFSF